ncbi:MAG: DegQ family serine endoprotease [Planctomycetota bacterium]
MSMDLRTVTRKSLATTLLLCVSLFADPLTAAAQERRAPKQPPTEALRTATALSEAFEYAADQVRPAVVSIRAVRQPRTSRGGSRDQQPQTPGLPFDEDFLRRFFGESFQLPQPMPQQASGSGVIVSEDGYILTNNHVVGGADRVEVALPNGRRYRAEVVGSDPLTDVAVVRIKAENLKPARLGKSGELRIGEWVLAAGNPFGFQGSITAGIVSATGRRPDIVQFQGEVGYEDFIQTDAAINPGNSGGPLVNLAGEVVGINTAIATRTGGNMGIGFAIPVDMARFVMDSIIKTGEVVRGWLGVSIAPLTEDLARTFEPPLDITEGAVVAQVLPNTPAEEAGLKRNDVVTAVNGTPIRESAQLRNMIAAMEPGTKVKLRLLRNGKERDVTVVVGKREGNVMARSGARGEESEALGLRVSDLTAVQAERLGLERGIEGVLVTEVEQAGIAAESGLRPGDVILEVQGTPVRDTGSFWEQVGKRDLKRGVRLLVQSGNAQRFVVLRDESGE